MNISSEELAKLGTQLRAQLNDFIADRNLLELQWLKNLRQYQGKYDPEIAALIPEDRSHVYPRDTRIKVKGGVAKMMEMMFPSREKNWEVIISPNPSIPKEELQNIIEALQVQTDDQGQPVPITSDAIERKVRAFATARKDDMEQEIADQLADSGVDYPQLCKKVVRSGYIYGFGIARSPMVRTQIERIWRLDETTGEYVAERKKIRRPYPGYCRIWDGYPDLAAKSWEDQEMFFERFVFARNDFRKLTKRPDFKGATIKNYLRDHPTGNYTAKTYETTLQEIAKTANLTDRTARRYEAYRALGYVSAYMLQKAGVLIKEADLDQDVFADMWFIDNVVIKAEIAAYGQKVSDQYHAFIYAEDEDAGLTGIGLPEEVRDSQLSLCASTRAMMDNMAAVAGPIFEVNIDLLANGAKSIGPIHSFMTIEREGDGQEANYPAVRQLSTDSHIGDILPIIKMQRQQLDVESNLPAYTMGATQQQPLGEAFRTTSNMSMMMGSANMVTKDTVRAFDKFTSSLIGSLLKWNIEFNPDETIKGDFQVQAKGNLSLVAKEVRGAALDQFVSTLDDEDKAILDRYGLLIDRLKSRDLPTNRLLPRPEAERILDGMKQAASQTAQVDQGLIRAKTQDANASAQRKQVEAQRLADSADATIKEILSRVENNLAMAKTQQERTQLENLKTLLSTVVGKNEQTKGG